MSYTAISAYEVINKIKKNDIYLPAIQRKFVWNYEQIEKLFDSIMRNYPIGTFLFWFVEKENINKYTFYKFIQEYNEKNNYKNEIAPSNKMENEIIGILDGQQRLSSMWIALQGSYAYKKPYVRKDTLGAFPKRYMYLNLLYLNNSIDSELQYQFKFLIPAEAKKIDDNNLWFKVSDILSWNSVGEANKYFREISSKNINLKTLFENQEDQIIDILSLLYEKVNRDKIINFYKVDEQNLDKILDVFVRVNSAGTVLSKTDLLFSTIVAHWEDGRDIIDEFLESLNEKGDKFRFNVDFIMRTCLVLIDAPVLFKVENFKKENIVRIKKSWFKIAKSIDKTVGLLIEYGINGENLTSLNAVIPIAYYYMKGGKDNRKIRKEWQTYLIRSLIKQIFGGQGDSVLNSIRENLRDISKIPEDKGFMLKDKVFNFVEFTNKLNLPGKRNLNIDDEIISEIVEDKKGPYTFLILSLLYPQLKFAQNKFHQDHIHPASMFNDKNFNKINLSQEKRNEWINMRDKLPNLQLMQASENESKNKTPLKDWLYGKDSDGIPNVQDISKFKKDNYFPRGVNEDFESFERFYLRRKNILTKALKRKLTVTT